MTTTLKKAIIFFLIILFSASQFLPVCAFASDDSLSAVSVLPAKKRMLYDFSVPDKNDYSYNSDNWATSNPTRGDISGNYGARFTKIYAPGSTHSLGLQYNEYGMYFYDNSSYNPRTNLDWTEYKYVVFRMRASGEGDKVFNISFAPQTTQAGGNLSRNTIKTIGNVVDVPVTINQQWNDYKIPVSDLSSAYLNSYTKKTIGGFRFHHVDHTKSEDTSPRPAYVYIDSIFLEGYKNEGESLNEPMVNVNSGAEVPPDITGDSTVKFTFEEELLDLSYSSAATVLKDEEEISSSLYDVTSSSDAESSKGSISVKFKGILENESIYKVVLKPGMIYSISGKCLTEPFVVGFTVGYKNGYISFDKSAIQKESSLKASFYFPPSENPFKYNLITTGSDGSVISGKSDSIIPSDSSATSDLSLVVPSSAECAKAYIKNSEGMLIYLAILNEHGKTASIADETAVINNLNISDSSAQSIELSLETSKSHMPVLVTLIGSNGTQISENALISSDGGEICDTVIFKEELVSDIYTIKYTLGNDSRHIQYKYISKTDRDTLKNLSNAKNSATLFNWLKQNKIVLVDGFGNEDKLLDLAQIITRKAPYTSYEEVISLMNKTKELYSELKACIWSNLSEFITKNNKYIFDSGFSAYERYESFSATVKNELSKSVINGKSFETLKDLRNSFEVVVSNYNPPAPGPSPSTGGSVSSSFTNTTAKVPNEQEPSNNDYFKDIANYQWAKESINKLLSLGIVSKSDDFNFRPSDNVKREEFVKMLVEAFFSNSTLKGESFADEAQNSWYNTYLSKARALGIVNGREDGSFGINENISREDMAVMSCRVMDILNIKMSGSDLADFSDKGAISSYATESISAMVGEGILKGMSDGSFAPKQNATRAQAAVLISRIIDFVNGGINK